MSASVSALPLPSAKRRPTPGLRPASAATRRRTAKAGMAVSLGVLVWSGLGGRRLLRRYHVLAGVALLGFTAWHMSLYRARETEAGGGRSGS